MPTGAPLTVHSAQAGLSGPNGAGTPYGGASAPLRAKTAVTPGAHTVILSILDLNDNAYDTAVFADALRTSNESAATCVRGSQAIGPGLAITGPGPGFTSRSRFPTLTGTAGNGSGDDPTVTVRDLQRGRHLGRAGHDAQRAAQRRRRGRSRPPRRSPPGPTPPRPRRGAPTAAPASARR